MIDKGKGWTVKNKKYLYVWVYDQSATHLHRLEMSSAGYRMSEVFSKSKMMCIGNVEKLNNELKKMKNQIEKEQFITKIVMEKIKKYNLDTDEDRLKRLVVRKAHKILAQWSEIEFEAARA
ncbi:hypothetical protein ACFQ4X_06935 [Fictibacillus halophilus]|uniref:hypothetical protein n=1 Tax=Fictibacillus halophilus TaxID=1610490 RepID=UPI00362CD8DA